MEECSCIPWAALLDKNMVGAFHEAHPEKPGGHREALSLSPGRNPFGVRTLGPCPSEEETPDSHYCDQHLRQGMTAVLHWIIVYDSH